MKKIVSPRIEQRAADDDLVPMPADENNPAVLRALANEYGLEREFDLAYPTRE